MRSTTQVHVAFRNVGDSQDIGSFYEGTVSECILWLATQVANKSMATRFTFGMGRNQADAARGIEIKGTGQYAPETMSAMLESVFEGSAAPDFMESIKVKQCEGDDYVA